MNNEHPNLLTPQFLRQKIKRIPHNENGRDFVVGDLHGCYHALIALMKEVKFNKMQDRMISVGDLIDRGPESYSCLELLEKPWFYAVAGNHELMLIDFLKNPRTNTAYDLKWIKEKAKNWTEQRIIAGKFLNRLINLPLVLSVGEKQNHYYVVHAEIVDKKMTGRTAIENWDFMNKQQVELGTVWGRRIIYAYKSNKILKSYKDSVRKIYCGHTIVNAPLKIDKQIYLDKGAYMPYYFKDKKDYKEHEPGLLLIEANSDNAWIYDTEKEKIDSLLLRGL